MMWRSIERVVRAQETAEGGGVRLKRALGTTQLGHLDPLLLLDEFKSDDSTDYQTGFPDHPHRGFKIVTYMLAGAMRHRDHLGHERNLVAGSVQWMTAGRGIVHSEMPQQTDGLLWGVQLWVNLPAVKKTAEPCYQDIAPELIPEVSYQGAHVRIVAGALGGVRGPVAGVATEPIYLDLAIPAGERVTLELPADRNACCYVVRRPRRNWGARRLGWHTGGHRRIDRPRQRGHRVAGGNRPRVGARACRQADRRTGGALRAVRHDHRGGDPSGGPGFSARDVH